MSQVIRGHPVALPVKLLSVIVPGTVLIAGSNASYDLLVFTRVLLVDVIRWLMKIPGAFGNLIYLDISL